MNLYILYGEEGGNYNVHLFRRIVKSKTCGIERRHKN